MVQMSMVDMTVRKKYLKGNFTGMGLKIDLGNDLRIFQVAANNGDFFCVLSTVITSSKAGHLVLIDEGDSNAGK